MVQWLDKSGQGHHLLQASTQTYAANWTAPQGSAPKYNSTLVNGKLPALDFSDSASMASAWFPKALDLTLFIVATPLSPQVGDIRELLESEGGWLAYLPCQDFPGP